MMARPRSNGRKFLPNNLYVQQRSRGDYFTYRNPLTGESKSLGYDFDAAVVAAERINQDVAADAGYEFDGDSPRALLSAEDIFRCAYPLGSFPGVYFLLKGVEIVYVGKSLDVESRIGQHRTRRKIDFDAVFMIECAASEISRLEARYLRALKPRLNAAFPAGVYGGTVAKNDTEF